MKHTHTYMVNLMCSCLLLVCTFYFMACKKIIQVPPPSNQVISSLVFNDDATATSAVTGIYSEMMNNFNQFCTGNTTLYTGLASDELTYYTASVRDEFLKNEITEASHGNIATYFWNNPYKYIYYANACIEGLYATNSVSTQLKNTLIGEAKFIRAFCYFYLVNFFGDIPLTTSTVYSENAVLSRTSADKVLSQVIVDLEDARTLIPAAYALSEKLRPNKWAATALLARAYLYTRNWSAAEAAATEVINSNAYSLVTNLNNVFLKGSTETIWQLYPVNTVWNTWEARDILPPSSSALPQYMVTSNLLSFIGTTDARKSAWITSKTVSGNTYFYPFKYKVYGNNAPQTEYYVVLRLAEQFLIRAEARAQQSNITGAKTDLNTIRSRASLPPTAAVDQPSMLSAIESERRIELMFEWGHRWFDLKRTGRADVVLGALKPSTWQSTDALWPVPVSQLNTNPFLTQNPGY